jgi:electron transfer flavoprotein beta subunit
MNLLVCVSKTPETTAKIAFTNDNTAYDSNGVNFIMNPYDEWYALVRAIELKEANGGKVTIVNVGDASNDIIIRKGLAIGADEAVRIDATPTSAYETAAMIADYARDKGYDIIFTGKESIDYNGSQMGGILAEMLDLPYISYATSLEVAGTTSTLTREIEGGAETLEVDGAFVVSAAKGMAEQRIANMRGIMMAKRKPLEVVSPTALSSKVETVSFALPDEKGGVKMMQPDDMDELVRLLHEEAKVI